MTHISEPPIHFLLQTSSTQDWVRERLKSSSKLPDEIFGCLAGFQSCGRGRNGNQWFDSGGPMNRDQVSVSFFIPGSKFLTTSIPPYLAILVGHEIFQSLLGSKNSRGLFTSREHFLPFLKWPNDFVVLEKSNKKIKKFGGILVEALGAQKGVVIGVGINLRQNPSVNRGNIEPLNLLAFADLTQGFCPSVLGVAYEVYKSLDSFFAKWTHADSTSSVTWLEPIEKTSMAPLWGCKGFVRSKGDGPNSPSENGMVGTALGLDMASGYLRVRIDQTQTDVLLAAGEFSLTGV